MIFNALLKTLVWAPKHKKITIIFYDDILELVCLVIWKRSEMRRCKDFLGKFKVIIEQSKNCNTHYDAIENWTFRLFRIDLLILA